MSFTEEEDEEDLSREVSPEIMEGVRRVSLSYTEPLIEPEKDKGKCHLIVYFSK